MLYADGGGRVSAVLTPIHGRDAIVRFMADLATKNGGRVPFDARAATVNGLPGLILSVGGVVIQTLAFEICDGSLSAIHAVRNPEKLVHVGWH
ncbi:MAG TPA: hypothetical protein VKP30_20520 [Polyangiaceae bacterium]|nr:hypothetical protein [Polyangiaceae bacterium]